MEIIVGCLCPYKWTSSRDNKFFLEKSRQNIWSESKLALSLHPLSERNSTDKTIFDTISYRQVVRRACSIKSMSKGNTNRQFI